VEVLSIESVVASFSTALEISLAWHRQAHVHSSFGLGCQWHHQFQIIIQRYVNDVLVEKSIDLLRSMCVQHDTVVIYVSVATI
jgi:hypothetical protein